MVRDWPAGRVKGVPGGETQVKSGLTPSKTTWRTFRFPLAHEVIVKLMSRCWPTETGPKSSTVGLMSMQADSPPPVRSTYSFWVWKGFSPPLISSWPLTTPPSSGWKLTVISWNMPGSTEGGGKADPAGLKAGSEPGTVSQAQMLHDSEPKL